MAATLSAENWSQLWVPPGFLHGFCTLEPDTEVAYKVTAPYDKASERAVLWNDPGLALPWPIAPGEAVLSDKDRELPGFAAAAGWFPPGPAVSGPTPGAPAGGNGPVLVTGGEGQLALALEAAGSTVGMERVGRPAFDFDRPDSIRECFERVRPRLVMNAAAWTAVDAAEAEPDAAARANRDGPRLLAELCAAAGVPLLHVSTDYVFDGDKPGAYVETDAPSPTGVYGRTKLEGERAVLDACPQAMVLRTAWVYSHTGKNFVRTMLGAAQRTSTLRVVADQHGCPTNAADLAEAMLAVAARIEEEGFRPEWHGVFHAAGTGDTSWHGLAVATFEAAARHGRPMPEVVPIATADWPTPARRPLNSRLDCAKLQHAFGVRLPAWQPSLERTVAMLVGG